MGESLSISGILCNVQFTLAVPSYGMIGVLGATGACKHCHGQPCECSDHAHRHDDTGHWKACPRTPQRRRILVTERLSVYSLVSFPASQPPMPKLLTKAIDQHACVANPNRRAHKGRLGRHADWYCNLRIYLPGHYTTYSPLLFVFCSSTVLRRSSPWVFKGRRPAGEPWQSMCRYFATLLGRTSAYPGLSCTRSCLRRSTTFYFSI